MFGTFRFGFARIMPQVSLRDLWRPNPSMHQNRINPEEMPESWQRDIGLLDGRDRRGDRRSSPFDAACLISMHRNL